MLSEVFGISQAPHWRPSGRCDDAVPDSSSAVSATTIWPDLTNSCAMLHFRSMLRAAVARPGLRLLPGLDVQANVVGGQDDSDATMNSVQLGHEADERPSRARQVIREFGDIQPRLGPAAWRGVDVDRRPFDHRAVAAVVRGNSVQSGAPECQQIRRGRSLLKRTADAATAVSADPMTVADSTTATAPDLPPASPTPPARPSTPTPPSRQNPFLHSGNAFRANVAPAVARPAWSVGQPARPARTARRRSTRRGNRPPASGRRSRRSAVARVESPREENRGRLQNLASLRSRTSDPLGLGSCDTGPLGGINLRLQHPSARAISVYLSNRLSRTLDGGTGGGEPDPPGRSVRK